MRRPRLWYTVHKFIHQLPSDIAIAMSTPLSRSAQVSPLITDDESDYKDEHEKNDRCTLSFNDPITGSTRPAYIFPLFVIINISTMVDRSIILGASLEFSAFLSSAQDSPQAVKDNPDLGIGLLQGKQYVSNLNYVVHA